METCPRCYRYKVTKSVSEAMKPDILPVSGGGQEGTNILRQNYQDATPGQKVKRFKDYTKHK